MRTSKKKSSPATYLVKNRFQLSDLCSIIVTFQPKLLELTDILKHHIDNFQMVIIVNNSIEIDLSQFESIQEVIIINNSSNIGLAAALNIGILEAKKQGAEMVALFDQDSDLTLNFTQEMLHYINQYQGDKPVAVYSPIYYNHVIDETTKHINFKPFRLIREAVDENDYAHPHYVITSGSIIPMDVLDDVGLMREELFIDFIDIEWCLRARQKGYEIVAINKVMLDHRLGDYSVNILGNRYPIHTPLRMYYYFRNAIFLYRLREIEWNWRLVDATRNLFRFLFYLLFVNNRPTYLNYIIKGYYHGLIKKMGKLEE